jgi:hypothetical protein
MIGFSIFLTLFIPSRCGRTARSGNAGNADIQANKMNNITGTRTNQQLYIMRENTAAEISLRRCCCFCILSAQWNAACARQNDKRNHCCQWFLLLGKE